MTDEQADRLFTWFYDKALRPTALWSTLEQSAYYILRRVPDSVAAADDVAVSLDRRARAHGSDVFPVPFDEEPILSNQRDFPDMLRYCRRAVARSARGATAREGRERQTFVAPLSGRSFEDDPRVESARSWSSHPEDPTAYAVAETMSTSEDFGAWIRALKEVRQLMATDARLAPEKDRAACLAYLDRLVEPIQPGPVPSGTEPAPEDQDLVSAAMRDAVAVLANSTGGPQRLVRAFRTSFHHAFWRTVGELHVGGSHDLLDATALAPLGAFAGVDVPTFMEEHHRNMMRTAPRPFTPRQERFPVPNRVLLFESRRAWWECLIHRMSRAADPLPPPVDYVLPESKV